MIMSFKSDFQSYPVGSKRPWEPWEPWPPWETQAYEDALEDALSSNEDTGEESSSESEIDSSSQASEVPEEVTRELHEIKQVLRKGLDGISSFADQDRAFGGRLDGAPNPGLTLKSSGILGLPLSPRDLFRIRHEADWEDEVKHRTGYSCIVGSDRFELKNPAWTSYVHSLVSKILSTHPTSDFQIQLVDLTLQDHGWGYPKPKK